MSKPLRLENNRFIGGQVNVPAYLCTYGYSINMIRRMYRDVYPFKRGRLREPIGAVRLIQSGIAIAKTTSNIQRSNQILDVITSRATTPEISKFAYELPRYGRIQSAERMMTVRATNIDEDYFMELLNNGTVRIAQDEIQGYHESNGYPLEYVTREQILDSKSITINTLATSTILDTTSKSDDKVTCAENFQFLVTPEPTRKLESPEYRYIDTFNTSQVVELVRAGGELTRVRTYFDGNLTVYTVRTSTVLNQQCVDDQTPLLGEFSVEQIHEDKIIRIRLNDNLPRLTHLLPATDLHINRSTLGWMLFTFLVPVAFYVSASYIVKTEQLNANISNYEFDNIETALMMHVVLTPPTSGVPEDKGTSKRENVVAQNIVAEASGLYTKPERRDNTQTSTTSSYSPPAKAEQKGKYTNSSKSKPRGKPLQAFSDLTITAQTAANILRALKDVGFIIR